MHGGPRLYASLNADVVDGMAGDGVADCHLVFNSRLPSSLPSSFGIGLRTDDDRASGTDELDSHVGLDGPGGSGLRDAGHGVTTPCRWPPGDGVVPDGSTVRPVGHADGVEDLNVLSLLHGIATDRGMRWRCPNEMLPNTGK